MVVDADAMLSRAIALKCLEPVSRWYPHEIQGRCGIHLSELAARNRFNIHEASNAASKMQGLRIAAFERLNCHCGDRISKYDITQGVWAPAG